MDIFLVFLIPLIPLILIIIIDRVMLRERGQKYLFLIKLLSSYGLYALVIAFYYVSWLFVDIYHKENCMYGGGDPQPCKDSYYSIIGYIEPLYPYCLFLLAVTVQAFLICGINRRVSLTK